MNKKLIALAVAGAFVAPAVAMAQGSNLTIYGVADVYWVNANASGQSVNAINAGQSAGNRIGFKGSEDLGGGLSAVFTLEHGFNIDNGTDANGDAAAAALGRGTLGAAGNGIFTRQAWVGLSFKDVGTFSAGRQYAPGYFQALIGHGGDWYVLGPISALLGRATDSGSQAGIFQAATPARISNSLVYQSANWSGFSARVLYSLGNERSSTTAIQNKDDNRLWGLGLTYDNGPLVVGFNYDTTDIPDGTGNTQRLRETALVASYDFQAAKVYGFYVKADDDTRKPAFTAATCGGVAGGDCSGAKTWALGVNIPVGASKVGNVKVAYAKKTVDNTSNEGATGWMLAYEHALSKRTALYGVYSKVNNDSQAAFNIAGSGLTAVPVGDSPRAIGLGMRHTF